MNVCLIRPFNKYSYSMTPPLGLGYLASTLKIKGKHNVYLFEAVRDNISGTADLAKFISKLNPQVVGIQVYTVDLLVVKEYLQKIKQINKQIITVLGGPHPSTVPEETMNYFGPDVDFIIEGEGERGLLALVNMLSNNCSAWEKVPGLVWRNVDDRIIRNKKEFVKDLNEIPWPDWELLDLKSYKHAPLGGFSKNFPMAPIIVSRGCPYRCTFCAAKTIYGTGFRYRDIDDVIAEIIYLRDRFGVKEIMIQDDNITFKKSVILDFCEKMRPLKMDWNCLNGIRLNTIDDEVAENMMRSGCYAVAVGIESGSQRILDDMNKKLKLDLIMNKVNILAKHKMKITGQFMVGYPTEKPEDIQKTIEFAKKLPIERAAFASFMPLPGSQIYSDLLKQGKLENVEFEKMSYYNVVRSFTPHVPTEELAGFLKKAVKSFYLRPSIIFKMMISIGSPSNFWNLLVRFAKNYI